MSNAENGLLKFITCGSVDDGKSTLIGHILYDSKLLYADQEQALILDSQVGSRGGAIDYSLLLDGLMAEREQGITIDVAYRYFTTDRRSFIVADTPGHEEYTRNMAVGASFADLAVILVDASLGVLVQTRRHARICALMGIRYFVFAVNKMDLIGYDQKRFAKISGDIGMLKAELGLQDAVIIPVSATEGDNVTWYSDKMPWYQGDTLLAHLETVDVSGNVPETGFYMPVQRVCRPDHSFRGFQGQIEAGKVAVCDMVTALPSGEIALVKSIHIGDKEAESAVLGQPATIQLDREVDVSRGCVLTRNTELKIAKAFSATLLWMDDQRLVPGKEYWIKLGTKLLPAIVTGISHKVDVNDGTLLPADSIVKNEIVRCEIVLSEPAILDEFRLHKTLGELILIDRVSHATAACGVIETTDEQKQDSVFLSDGSGKLQINLFDQFYYHPDIHTILRHSPSPAAYAKGDTLPLRGEGFNYPFDFDLVSDSDFANIRDGIFIGFGPRESRYPLLDASGIEVDAPRDFGKYHKVMIWEKKREAEAMEDL
ncbi:sulfate adenylyltransferase subunit 1 [Anaerocolumna xylanovorans]|uniref:sulfate adenylyltransferase n=1 Tax=Anaerocolumna xylanovorans DSM 12503 TaxID=1121345 RepID=A0A1M7YN45_9FIRM|nr:GTP-binding protein [Anaerocolumna xylanovorans]SHO53958.1 sulfate adenylyltransferase subunit 1 [Anaerocolumna xylanovorans DSM 12503]